MLSILSLIRNGQILETVIVVLSRCFIVFCCMPVHELAHGWVAYKLGDNTAKNQGRLSFNPLAHLSPIGTVMIFLFGIGYAKAVPVNPNNFKNPKQGMALTALAGPVSNIIMSFISIWIAYIFAALLPYGTFASVLIYFFYFAANVNVVLAVFNLFPIPPLDGSKILAAVLPDEIYYKYMQYERYIMIVLLALLFFGVLSTPISWLSDKLLNLISFVPRLIFKIEL